MPERDLRFLERLVWSFEKRLIGEDMKRSRSARTMKAGVSLFIAMALWGCSTGTRTLQEPINTSSETSSTEAYVPEEVLEVLSGNCREPHSKHGIVVISCSDLTDDGDVTVSVVFKREHESAPEAFSVWLWPSYKTDHFDPLERVKKLSPIQCLYDMTVDLNSCTIVIQEDGHPKRGYYYPSVAIDITTTSHTTKLTDYPDQWRDSAYTGTTGPYIKWG